MLLSFHDLLLRANIYSKIGSQVRDFGLVSLLETNPPRLKGGKPYLTAVGVLTTDILISSHIALLSKPITYYLKINDRNHIELSC